MRTLYADWKTSAHISVAQLRMEAAKYPLTASTDPDQNLTVWTAAPGSPTHDWLRILASWAADQELPASSPPS